MPKRRRLLWLTVIVLIAAVLVLPARGGLGGGPDTVRSSGSGRPASGQGGPHHGEIPTLRVVGQAAIARTAGTSGPRRIEWQTTVANLGSATASRVRLHLMGQGVHNFVSSAASSGNASSPNSWSVGTLEPGQSKTLTGRAIVDSDAAGAALITSWASTPDLIGTSPVQRSSDETRDAICQANHSLADDTDQCDMTSVAIPGQPSLTVRAQRAVPGARMEVSARIRGPGGPVTGAPVTFEQSGSREVVTRSDSTGSANGWLTGRAGRSTVVVSARVHTRRAAARPVTVRALSMTTSIRPALGPATQPMLHRTGAYGVFSAQQVKKAAASGLDLIMTSSSGPRLRQAAARAGTSIIDGRLKGLLYSSLCGRGGKVCRVVRHNELANISGQAESIVNSPAAQSSPTVAWYLTDDYFDTSFRPALATIKQALRRSGDGRPTVCAFGLNLVPLDDASAAQVELRRFQQRLVNYDPSWCDAVVLYAYPPASRHKKTLTIQWDWGMKQTLSRALALLRKAGWDPAHDPLIGAPASFGWNPRTVIREGSERVQYRAAPSKAELVTQMNAFCGFGASSLLAFAWNDGSRGPQHDSIETLSNSPRLRQGLQSGSAICRNRYWPDHAAADVTVRD